MNSVLQGINHVFDEGSINAFAALIDFPSHGNGSKLGYYLSHLFWYLSTYMICQKEPQWYDLERIQVYQDRE